MNQHQQNGTCYQNPYIADAIHCHIESKYYFIKRYTSKKDLMLQRINSKIEVHQRIEKQVENQL